MFSPTFLGFQHFYVSSRLIKSPYKTDTLVYIATPYKRASTLVSQENETYKGNNSSGFSLIMMGYIWNGRDDFGDTATYLWSSTELNDSLVYTLVAYKGTYTDTANVAKANAIRDTKFSFISAHKEPL